ncbi:MAG: uncharacterized protein QOI86_5563 [Actinomycetota bacterium]|jgi:predicted TIM-barrel fold metal-dependent hydrolase|nr:uncharacterized protein [Actinomycetota bacterium]
MAQAIDIHVHPGTHEWLGEAMGPFRGDAERHFGTPVPERTVDEMAEEFRGQGILAVLLAWNAGAGSGLPPVTNEFVASCVAAHPDVFVGFASVDPWQGKKAEAELRYALDELGLKGVKFHPTAQAFEPNDRRFYPLYEIATERRCPLLFHTGTTGLGINTRGGGGLKLGYSRPIFLDDVAADFPDADIVAAHPSWPWQDEMLAVARHKANVWIDLSGWSPRRWSPELAAAVLGDLQDRVLFGTDYPFIVFDRWLKAFRSYDPSPELERKVLLDNASRLLNLDQPSMNGPGAPGRKEEA